MNPMSNELVIAAHDFLATAVSRRALWAFRHLKAQTRSDGAIYSQALSFRKQAWDWDESRRKDWMLVRLREVVRCAALTTPFYRERFASIGFDPSADFGFSEFAALPVLERSEVQEAGDSILSSDVPRAERQWNATGGSSGRPVEIQMGPRERAWRSSGADFSMRRLGVEPGVRRALLWGHHLDPVARDSFKDRLLDALGNRAWFDCLRLSPSKLLDYDDAMRRYRPRCLVAYASALAFLAETIESARRAPAPYPTRRIVTGAEKLLKEQREIVERVFQVPVHERYGSRDVGDVGFQYEPWNNLHYRIDWALVFVEPATDGPESDILVTKLQADAMPMIRYRTDDVGIFAPGAKPGEPQWVLHEVLGRRADRVFRPDGGWVNGLHFPHLFKDFRLRDFKVHQREDYSLDVRVVLPADAPADALAVIQANLRENLPGVSVEVSAVEEIERTKANKWRPVVSDVRVSS